MQASGDDVMVYVRCDARCMMKDLMSISRNCRLYPRQDLLKGIERLSMEPRENGVFGLIRGMNGDVERIVGALLKGRSCCRGTTPISATT
jgi:hypothetical protein